MLLIASFYNKCMLLQEELNTRADPPPPPPPPPPPQTLHIFLRTPYKYLYRVQALGTSKIIQRLILH